MLKRNSGFIVGCVLAAGVSFFAADVAMSDQVLLKMPSTELSEEEGTEKTLDPEQITERVYETDPFTVTASGMIVKGAETEIPKQTEKEKDQPETDADGNVIDTPETDAEGNVIGTPETDAEGNVIGTPETNADGSVILDSGADGNGGSNASENGSWNEGDSSSNGNGGWDGSYDDSYDQEIEIRDPGNGNYEYTDGSGSSGGGSSSGSSGAWTPDEVILWGISSRYIDESELYNYSAGQLRLIRNEIFALHGRIFRSQDLADYFSRRSWYVPTYDPDEFDANMFYYLNDYEEANLKVILNYEAALGGY